MKEMEKLYKFLDELRNHKEFDSLKKIRDHIKHLINVNNRDWFQDNKSK